MAFFTLGKILSVVVVHFFLENCLNGKFVDKIWGRFWNFKNVEDLIKINLGANFKLEKWWGIKITKIKNFPTRHRKQGKMDKKGKYEIKKSRKEREKGKMDTKF